MRTHTRCAVLLLFGILARLSREWTGAVALIMFFFLLTLKVAQPSHCGGGPRGVTREHAWHVCVVCLFLLACLSVCRSVCRC